MTAGKARHPGPQPRRTAEEWESVGLGPDVDDVPPEPRANGNGHGEWAKRVIDTKAPFATAKLFRGRTSILDNGSTLYHHRGAFYRWDGNSYREIIEAELRAQLYTFMDESITETEKGTIPVKPTTRMISDVLDALRAASYLTETIAPPAWLNDNISPPAAEIVACKNGLLHLPTLELMPNSSKFFNHNALDFGYDRDASEPGQWLNFLHTLWSGDPEAISALQEIFGYCLTADTSQQKAFLLIGPKRSGKGTIARVLARLIGTHNTVAPTLAGLGTNFGLAPLIGKRVAIISDARLSARADQHAIAERILSITGEDAITIDRKYSSAWTGQMQTRFVILSNLLPRLADASGALASRFIVLMLVESFLGREDKILTKKLFAELPGILNWAIKGYNRLTNFGYFKQPQSALDAVQMLEDLSSPVGEFLRERCLIGAAHSVSVATLFSEWTDWSKANGQDRPGTSATFGKNLRAAASGVKTIQQKEAEDRIRWYQGIGLK